MIAYSTMNVKFEFFFGKYNGNWMSQSRWKNLIISLELHFLHDFKQKNRYTSSCHDKMAKSFYFPLQDTYFEKNVRYTQLCFNLTLANVYFLFHHQSKKQRTWERHNLICHCRVAYICLVQGEGRQVVRDKLTMSKV